MRDFLFNMTAMAHKALREGTQHTALPVVLLASMAADHTAVLKHSSTSDVVALSALMPKPCGSQAAFDTELLKIVTGCVSASDEE